MTDRVVDRACACFVVGGVVTFREIDPGEPNMSRGFPTRGRHGEQGTRCIGLATRQGTEPAGHQRCGGIGVEHEEIVGPANLAIGITCGGCRGQRRAEYIDVSAQGQRAFVAWQGHVEAANGAMGVTNLGVSCGAFAVEGQRFEICDVGGGGIASSKRGISGADQGVDALTARSRRIVAVE